MILPRILLNRLEGLIKLTLTDSGGMQGQRWHLPKGYQVVATKDMKTNVNHSSHSAEYELVRDEGGKRPDMQRSIKDGDEDGTPILTR